MRTLAIGWRSRVALAISVSLIVAFVSGAPVPEENYVFVLDVQRWVCIMRHGDQLLGKLDPAGNFLLESKRPTTSGGSGPPRVLLNKNYQWRPQAVYEYRSGRLIKGELTPEGDFLPEVGSKVIRFEEYKFGPNALTIWNLPGYFKKVEKGKDAKDEKK